MNGRLLRVVILCAASVIVLFAIAAHGSDTTDTCARSSDGGECTGSSSVATRGEESSLQPPSLDSVAEAVMGLPKPTQSRRDFIDAIAALYASQNLTSAIALLQKSAEGGEARAHWMLAAMYSIGIGVMQSEAHAVLHHTFAAMGGTPESHAALAYRFQHGLGVPQSCEKALFHAQAVADAVAASYHDDIVPTTVPTKLNSDSSVARSARKQRGLGLISTFLGAQMAESSSVAAAVAQLRGQPSDTELVQFHTYKSESGSGQSAMFLAYACMFGTHGVKQDGHKALMYLKLAMDASVPAAFGAVGQIYWQGMQRADPPILPDRERAFRVFRDGASRNDPTSINGLGVIYANGLPGVLERNVVEAAAHFRKGADQGNAESAYNLGVLHLLGKGDIKQDIGAATALFMRARMGGSPLAAWQLGNLHRRGVAGVVAASCVDALDHYRVIINRGSWSRLLQTAQDAYERKDYFTSFVDYALAAEVGSSPARWNMAYLLEEELVSVGDEADAADAAGVIVLNRAKVVQPDGPIDQEAVEVSTPNDAQQEQLVLSHQAMDPTEATEATVMSLLERAAVVDGDSDAHLKVGDRYYYGRPQNRQKAMEHYRIAAAGGNSQAKFNLGVLHQLHGGGGSSNGEADATTTATTDHHSKDDLHLAKRYYDEALSANPKAFVAVRLALMSLNAQWWLQHYGDAAGNGGSWSAQSLASSFGRGLLKWGASYLPMAGPASRGHSAASGLAWDDVLLVGLGCVLVSLLTLRNYLVHR